MTDEWKGEKNQIVAEVLGTYFMIFAGCGSVVVNLSTNGTVTFPGICAVWGLVVMVLVYSVGHISGAHFNPAVTVAFATCGRFPWKQVRALRNVVVFFLTHCCHSALSYPARICEHGAIENDVPTAHNIPRSVSGFRD